MIVEGFTAIRSNSYTKLSSGGAAAVGAAHSSADAVGAAAAVGTQPKPPLRTPRDCTSLEKHISTTLSTKSSYNNIVGQAEGILEQMQSDPDYEKEKLSYEADLLRATLAALKHARWRSLL